MAGRLPSVPCPRLHFKPSRLGSFLQALSTIEECDEVLWSIGEWQVLAGILVASI